MSTRGNQVTVSTRTAGPRANLVGLDIERVHGDDQTPGQIEEWVPGHSLVIDAAAPYALDLHDPEQSHAARLITAQDRMARLLRATARSGAVMVHIGSILTPVANGKSLRRRVIEAAHPYFRMKQEMERMAVDAARAGQPVVIVRPSSLLGPWNNRPFHHCFVSAIMTGGMPASFPETINVLDVRDAAETILRVADAGWLGQPVTIGGHDITVHDLTDRIVDLSGARRPPRWRALSAGAAVLYAAETTLGAAGFRSPYPSLPVLLTLASGPVAITGAQRTHGPALRPLNDTLRDEIAWHRARGCPG